MSTVATSGSKVRRGTTDERMAVKSSGDTSRALSFIILTWITMASIVWSKISDLPAMPTKSDPAVE